LANKAVDSNITQKKMNPIKRFLLGTYNQVEVRRHLRAARHPRALRPIISKTLFNGVRFWLPLLRFKPQVILDVGAYNGTTAAEFMELFHPTSLALVEPQPEMLPKLQLLAAGKPIRIFACAVGRNPGRAQMNILAGRASSTLLQPTADLGNHYNTDLRVTGRIEVEVRTLDSVFSEWGIPAVDLLKIDVEGYEVEAFAAGYETLERTHLVVCEAVFFEAHLGRPQFKQIYDRLSTQGFEMIDTFGWSFDRKGLPNMCNVLFMNRRLQEERMVRQSST
jgi:FkbM family methyltransferase